MREQDSGVLAFLFETNRMQSGTEAHGSSFIQGANGSLILRSFCPEDPPATNGKK